MAEAGRYGTVHVDGIPDDEPIFILRGQDMLTATGIRGYVSNCRLAGVKDTSYLERTLNRADEISDWQDANRDRVKLPN